MKTAELIVKNENGVHLRVAAEIVKRVQQHRSNVQIADREGLVVSARSIMELLSLGALNGAPLRVTADGPDETDAIQDLYQLFEDGAGI